MKKYIFLAACALGLSLTSCEDFLDYTPTAVVDNYALNQFGYPTHDTDAYRFFVGNGINKLFERALPESERTPENVLAYDLYPDYNFAREEQIVYTSLDELYHSSDIISLHCPLTEETKYLINDYSISKMKDGVMIINTGRGQLIHTNALIEGLKNKKIGSAGLDVYEEESEYFYEDQSDRIIDDDVLARLLSFNNVIVTSHQAFFTREAMENIAITTLQNIKDFINHKPLLNEVKR